MESVSSTFEIPGSSLAARSPRVSVMMGAYNGERFLRPAIESILSQTFRDFELIVVDDASNDRTPDILREFNDDRIKTVRNEHNLGIAATLNRALALARGEYIANQDHDDISLPTRFQKQVAFLDAHPDVVLVSCDADVLTDEGTKIWVTVPHSDLELKCGMLLSTSMHHTAMMARKSVIDAVGGYDPEYRFAEDYDLFSRIAYRHRVENIHEILVQAYKHRNIASTLHCEEQSRSGMAISCRNIVDLLSCDGETPLTQNAEKVHKVHTSDSKTEPFERYISRCMRAFSWGPQAEAPGVTSAEMIVGMQAFCKLHNIIYRKYRFSVGEVLDHKSRTRWAWGRRCIGLSRAERKLRLRLKFAGVGFRLLCAGLASAVVRRLLIPRKNRNCASLGRAGEL